MRNKLKLIIVTIIFLLSSYQNIYAKQEEPNVYASSAILVDLNSGRVLWQKNATSPLPIASTTKIMTAIIAIESGKLDDTVTVSKNAENAPKVKMYLKQKEQYRLGDLMYPLMLESSNDAAVAIAEHIGGSISGFADLMNKKAASLGAFNTKFVTPNGLDKDNNHSTALDLSIISRYALENETFLKYITAKEANISTLDGKRNFHFSNKNRFLSEYEGAFGVKTGFTNMAGHCFVGASKRDDKAFLSIVLASGWGTNGKERKWSDTKKIMNYAFDNFSYKTIDLSKLELGIIPVECSKKKSIPIHCDKSVSCLLSDNELDNLKIIKTVYPFLNAPIDINEKVGYITIKIGEKTLYEFDILTTDYAEKNDIFTNLIKIVRKYYYINQ